MHEKSRFSIYLSLFASGQHHIAIHSYLHLYYIALSIYNIYTHTDYDIDPRSLEVKLPTVWTDEKAEVGRDREEKRRRKKIKKEKVSEERRSRR